MLPWVGSLEYFPRQFLSTSAQSRSRPRGQPSPSATKERNTRGCCGTEHAETTQRNADTVFHMRAARSTMRALCECFSVDSPLPMLDCLGDEASRQVSRMLAVASRCQNWRLSRVALQCSHSSQARTGLSTPNHTGCMYNSKTPYPPFGLAL